MSKLSESIQARLTIFRRTFPSQEAVLLSNPHDICYFSGFVTLVPEEREGLLLITQGTTHLFHAHFSPFKPVTGITPVKGSSIPAIVNTLEQELRSLNLKKVLIDESDLTVAEMKQLQQTITVGSINKATIWEQRVVKDQLELAHMTRAAEIAKQVMAKTSSMFKVGITEQELCNRIEWELQELGSQRPAFPSIVAFGAHSALPHHQPTTTKLTQNTAVLLDFGATFNGYRSDMTRTVWFGAQPTQKFVRIEGIVKRAYQLALDTLKTGARPTAKKVDEAARSHIASEGFGDQFIHTTGHGLGLDIHEPPSLHWNNPQTLKPNTVMTIEPGIYLENEVGYRHENTVLVTANGVQELTI